MPCTSIAVVTVVERTLKRKLAGGGWSRVQKSKMAKTGIIAGANHGHIVTPREIPTKPSYKKGV